MSSLVAASTSVLAQHLWTAERGLEVSYIAAVCDADFGRARHVSCTQLAACCLHDLLTAALQHCDLNLFGSQSMQKTRKLSCSSIC